VLSRPDRSNSIGYYTSYVLSPWVQIGVLLVVTMWGLIFVAVHELLIVLDSIQIVLIRYWIFSFIFLLLLLFQPNLRPNFTRKDWGLYILAGILAVPGAQFPIVYGQRFLAPPLVSLIAGLTPVMAIFLARIFLAEKLSRFQFMGCLVALAGSLSIILVSSTDGTATTNSNPAMAALALISPLSWAGYMIFIRRVSTRHRALTSTGTAMILGTLSTAPFWKHGASGVANLELSHLLWLLYLAIGGTLLTYWIYFQVIAEIGANRAATYMFVVPLVALFWSWVILGYVPSMPAILGGAVVLTGVAMTQKTSSVQES
jgi:drug/metabolite transporter (DMT)-like permease